MLSAFYDADVRVRLLLSGCVMVLLVACGSGDGSGTRPSVTATLPSDASIVAPTPPPEQNVTTPPAETQPPEQPEQTAPPQQQPEETAVPSTVPAGDDGDGTLWWPWVLAGLALIVLIVAIARRRRPGPSWTLRTTALLDDVEQLTSHLAAVSPGGLQAVALADATRLATMRATLRDLVASAPDAYLQTAVIGLTTPLAELHGALDAVAMSAEPTVQGDPTAVSRLATQLHTLSASVRADLALHG